MACARGTRTELQVMISGLWSHHNGCMKPWTKYTRDRVLRHLIIGPGPCNFEIHKYRLFLESVCVGKQEIGLISDPSTKNHEIPPSSSIYTALRASFRLWVLFRLKFAIAATSRTSFVFNDQTKASQNPTLIYKLSSYIRNIQIAISVSCLFFVCLQETDPRGQVDRAPAWSITPRKLV